MMEIECPGCHARCVSTGADAEMFTCQSCGLTIRREEALSSEDPSSMETVSMKPMFEWSEFVQQAYEERFKPLERLGGGTYGEVILAKDNELDRLVAIKILRQTGEASGAAVSRFLNEARSVAKVTHPGIVTVYDVGRDGEGRNYLVMEHVPGGTLEKRMKQGPMAVEEAVRLLINVAEALHEAHKAGIVHRDLKPANILLDERGRPRVADFGLALLEEQQYHHRGEYAGTPVYMAPELVRGRAHHCDGRADIWSLGCIMYELLCGRRPFRGKQEQLEDEILHRDPKPLRQIDDRIPKELAEICHRCLQKDVAQRYDSMLGVAEELEQWLQAQSGFGLVQPIPEPRSVEAPTRPTRRVSRIWYVSMGLLMIAAIGLAAAALSSRLWRPKPLEAGLWYDLPLEDKSPEVLAISPNPTLASWDYIPASRRVQIDGRNVTILKLGEATASDYQLEVNLRKSALAGTSGVFLGWRPVKLDNGDDAFRYQAILLSIRTPTQIYLQREMVDLRFLPNGAPICSSRVCVYIPIEDFDFGEQRLEIVVQSSVLRTVYFRGREYKELRAAKVANCDPDYNCLGPFGLTNSFGSTTFSNCRIMYLRSPNP